MLNAIINRTKSLIDVADCTIHMYCLQAKPAGLNRIIRTTAINCKEDTYQIDGLSFHLLWYDRYLVDDVLANRIKMPPCLFELWARRIITIFKTYDIITAHSTRCGEVARLINKKYAIPFFVTWHGTDIHTTPFLSNSLKNYTTRIIKAATCNFFVSEALKTTAQSFVAGFKSEVLYNGISDAFTKYNEAKRYELREKYHVGTNKVVAFVGNLVPIKNASLLPQIFYEVKHRYNKNLSFWIIGDGNLRSRIEQDMLENNVECVFWGNTPTEDMPDMMNCIDVLVLPSKNESFGLVLVEAMACGANVVGSMVGGIPEVIGQRNTIKIDAHFISKISERIVFYLTNEVKQEVGKAFNLRETALKEYEIYKSFRKTSDKNNENN